MFMSGVVRVKLAIFAVLCFVLWQAIRTVPSASPFMSGVSDTKYDHVLPGASGSIVPVQVSVFYEALCPDSRSFITKQLLPSYTKAARLIDPVLIPYGKAETQKLPDGTYKFSCQHGPLECQGNKVHACVIKNVKNKEIQLKFVACMISNNMDPEGIGKSCAEQYSVVWDPILQCSRSEEGDKLLAEYGYETHNLSPKVSFIPTILLNQSQEGQAAILKNLLREVCKKYTDPKPEECS